MALNRSDKSRILRRYFPGMTRNSEMSTEPKLKPRWDVHLSGDDDQLGYAGESLSSYLENDPAPSFDPHHLRISPWL